MSRVYRVPVNQSSRKANRITAIIALKSKRCTREEICDTLKITRVTLWRLEKVIREAKKKAMATS